MSHSCTIRGIVVDARSRQPLGDVIVQVADTTQATTTDEQGRFLLTDVPAGSHVLFVSLVGYGLVRRDVIAVPGETPDVPIALSEGAASYAEDLTVAATASDPFDETTPVRQTLTAADLHELQGLIADDPFRAIQSLPGVASGDDFRSEFSIRGSPYRHIGVSLDGVFNPLVVYGLRGVEDTGSIALVNTHVLEQAVLLGGAYPQRFGGRLGAHLDLTMREGARDRLHVMGAVSGTSTSMVMEGPLGRRRRGSWIAAVRRSYLDWLVRRIDPDAGVTIGFVDSQIKLVFDLTSRQQVQMSALGGRLNIQKTEEAVSGNALRDGHNQAGSLNLAWRLTTPTWMTTHRGSLVAGRTWNLGTFDQQLGRGSDRDLAYRGAMVWSPGPRVALEAGWNVQQVRGAEVRRYFNLPAGGRPITRQLYSFARSAGQHGAFAHTRLGSRARSVSAGIRIDRFAAIPDTRPSPWVGGEWALSPAVRLRAGGGLQRQSPGFASLASPSESELGDERAFHLETGIDGQWRGDSSWTVAFYNREERDVARAVDAEPRLVEGHVLERIEWPRFRNALRGRARGVELFLRRSNPNGLSGWLSYAYGHLRYTDRFTGETFWGDFDQRHTLNVYGRQRWSSRTSASMRLRIGSNVPAVGYYEHRSDAYFLSDQRNQARLPTYARLDLRANRTFNYRRRRLTLFVEVLNVLGRTNFGPADGGINHQTLHARIVEDLLPILPSAGLLIEF